MSSFSIIDRNAAEALIPDQIAAEVVKAVTQESQALALCSNARMSSKVFRQPVLSALPVAYWVEGDVGLSRQPRPPGKAST
jgi:HK97 family phage major capsid protein